MNLHVTSAQTQHGESNSTNIPQTCLGLSAACQSTQLQGATGVCSKALTEQRHWSVLYFCWCLNCQAWTVSHYSNSPPHEKRVQIVPQCSAALQLNQPPEDALEKIALRPSGWRALPELTLFSSISRRTIILKLWTKLVQGRIKLIKHLKEKIGILRSWTGLWKDSFELHLTVTSVPCSWDLPLWAVSACLPPCQLDLFISPSLQAQ